MAIQTNCLTVQGVDLEWLKEKIPFIPVNLLEDIVDISHRHGKEALGVFYNGVIELAKNTPKGVEYHEAFHAVFNSYLSEDQRNRILKDTNKSEEQLADEFADYIQYDIRPTYGPLQQFFRKLKTWIKEKLGLLRINDLYSAIDEGYFKDRKPLNYTGNPKFKTVTDLSQNDLKLITESLVYDNLNYITQQQGIVNNNIYYIDWPKLTGKDLSDMIDESIDLMQEESTNQYFKDKFTPSNKNLIKNLIIKKISSILNVEIPVSEDSIEENKDYAVEVWERNPLQQEVSDKFNTEFKMFLENIPTYEWVGDKLQLATNELGYPYAVDSGVIMANLYQDMSNLGDIDLMIQTLELKKSEKPYYQAILDVLNDTTNIKSLIINGVERTSNNFKAQFFSSMANYLADIGAYTIQVDKVYNNDTKKFDIQGTSSRSRLINTTGTNNAILDEWLTVTSNLEDKETIKNEVKDIFLSFDEKLSERDSVELSNYLNKIGFQIHPKTLENQPRKAVGILIKELIDPSDIEKTTKTILRPWVNKQREFTDYNPNILSGSTGNQLNAVTNYTPLRRFVEKFKRKGNYYNNIISDAFYKPFRNSLLNLNKNPQLKVIEANNIIDNLSVDTMEGPLQIGSDTNTNAYSQMSEYEWEVLKINAYHNSNGQTGNIKGDFPTIVPSDKGNINAFLADKEELVYKDELGNINYHNFRVRLFNSFIVPELNRIQKVREISNYIDSLKGQLKEANKQKDKSESIRISQEIKELDIKNYYNNGKWFLFFPSLNDWLKTKIDSNNLLTQYYNENTTAVLEDGSYSALFTELNPLIDSIVQEVLATDRAYLDELGVFDSQLIDSSISKSPEWMDNYLANSLVKNIESTLLLSGDIAFYKNAIGNEGLNLTKLKNDLFTDVNKRAGQAQVPSRTLMNGTYNTAITKSIKKPSIISDLYIERIGEDLGNKYVETDITDAECFITTNRFIQIQEAKGNDGLPILEAYKRISENTSLDLESDLSIVMKPIKGFHFGLITETKEYIDSTGNKNSFTINVPTQIKYAQIPLIPAFTSRTVEKDGKQVKMFEDLDNLRIRMEESNIDELVFDSAFKDGSRKVHSEDELSNWLNGEGELSILTLSHDNYGEVLDIPTKDSTSETFSSQKQRLTLVNVKDDSTFYLNKKAISGKNIKDNYSDAIKNVLKSQYEAYGETLLTNGEIDIQKLKSKLSRLIEANSGASSDFSSYWKDLLNNLSEDTLYLLDLPQNRDKIYSLIANDFNKSVLDIEIEGKSAVLVSTYGIMYNITDLKQNLDNTLRPATLFDSNSSDQLIGENLDQIVLEYRRLGIEVTKDTNIKALLASNPIVTSDEIIVTPEYFIKSLKKKGIKPEKYIDSKGNFDILAIPEELRFVSFHRIPYQGKNSVSKAYIKEFSNVSQSSVIYFNPDILTRSGGDFDIDKVFIEFFEYSPKANGEGFTKDKSDKNTIVEIHQAIVSSPEMYNELITPNNSDDLDVIIKDLESNGIIKPNNNNYWWSNTKQAEFKKNNKAGKDLIGIYSIYNVFHGMAQLIKPKSIYPVLIGQTDKGVTEHYDMGGDYDFSGKLISENYQTIQTAAVDNAKEPKLGKLNHTMFTAPLKGYLLAHGVSLEVTEKFTNNPLYLSVIKYYNQYQLTEGSKAVEMAFNKTSEDFGIKYPYTNFEVIKDLKPLGNNVNKTDIDTLKSLMYHHQLSDKFNAFSRGLRLSNVGIKNTVADNQIALNKYYNDFASSEYFVYDRQLFNKSWLNEYETKFINFLNISSKITTHHSSFFENTFNRAKELDIKLNSWDQVNTFYSSLGHYIATNNDSIRASYEGNVNLRSSGITKKRSEFLNEDFPTIFNNWKKDQLNGIYKNNPFLKNIEIFNDSKTGRLGLRFKKVKDLNIDDIISSTELLFQNEEPMIKLLFGYTFKRYGFSKIKTSPMKYLENIFPNYNIEESYQLLYKDLIANEDPSNLNIDNFLLQFALNNPQQTRKLNEGETQTTLYKSNKNIVFNNKEFTPFTKREGVLNYSTKDDIFVEREVLDNTCKPAI